MAHIGHHTTLKFSLHVTTEIKVASQLHNSALKWIIVWDKVGQKLVFFGKTRQPNGFKIEEPLDLHYRK